MQKPPLGMAFLLRITANTEASQIFNLASCAATLNRFLYILYL